MKALNWLQLIALGLVACKAPEPPATPLAAEAHEDEKKHPSLPRVVRLADGVAAAAGLQVEKATLGVLAVTVSLPGEVAAEPDRTARVSAATAGRLEQVSFNEGTLVQRGSVMALLRVPEVGRLRGALGAATARGRASQANAERVRALQAQGLGAAQAVVDAEADARAQASEARALEEQLAAIGAGPDAAGGYLVPIRAPLSGVVVARDAVVGQPISAEHVLGTVVDLSEVWFLGRVFEKDLGRLRVGARAEVQLNAFPGERFGGTVDHLGQQIDPAARTLTARIRLANAGGRLRLGLFGTAHVEAEGASTAAPRVLIPRSAVTDLGGASVVFVREPDGDFTVHEVLLGEAALDRVQVLSGLDAGEAVASQGVFTLKSLLLKATLTEAE
jgi:cobalt-zinc-cadmium efflux system membrane fusion protein